MTAPRLLCVGDMDMDLLVAVDALPDFDTKRTGRRLGEWPGGMAANVAVAARRLGGDSRLVGVIGDDDVGSRVLTALRAESVDVTHCAVRSDCETFMCLVLVGPGGEKALLRMDTPAFMPEPGDITAAAFEGVGHVHLNYGSPVLVEHCMALAREAKATVSLDLEAADLDADRERLERVLGGVDVLFVNGHTRERLRDMGDPHRRAGAVVTTLGGDGAVFEAGDETNRQPGFPVEAVDSTGAGDCFAGAFLSRWLAGDPPADCLRFASAAAAISVCRHGAQAAAPTAAEVRAFIADPTPPEGERP